MAGRPRKRYLIALGLTALAVLVLPGAAQASKVFIKEVELGPRAAERGGGGTPVLHYRAAKGEDNRLRIDGGFTSIVVDKGATIKAGEGCERIGRHRARCEVPMTRQQLDVITFVRAKLKDVRDKAKGTGILWLLLDGGSGNDRLRGWDSADRINGGTGSDLINGGDNAEFNFDTATYHTRSDDLRISLRRGRRTDGGRLDGKPDKRDRLVGIESLVGGSGDDVFFGDVNNNSLIPLGGEDKVMAFAGTDFVDLGLDPFGGGDPDMQADEARCGADNDTLQGEDGLDSAVGCEG